jgi:hypothetical protein
MAKKSNNPFGPLHGAALKRNSYDKSGPRPAPGFPSSIGSSGPTKTVDRINREDAARKKEK